MSAKKIIFDHDALETVKLGVKQLSDAVKITLGPRGRNVGVFLQVQPIRQRASVVRQIFNIAAEAASV